MKKSVHKDRFETTLILKNIIDGRDLEIEDTNSAFQKSLLGITLRRLGEIEFYINKYLKKPIKKNNTLLKSNIFIAVSQILFMRIPSYAAVNEAVRIAKILNPNHVAFTNALLRKIASDSKKKKIKKINPICNIPKMFTNSWGNFLDKEEIQKISEQLIIIPPALDLVIKDSTKIEALNKYLQGSILGAKCIRIKNPKGNIKNYFGYKEGEWWIQDLAAQIPCNILINSKKNFSSIIDLCAAPGGKTAQLLSEGIKVISVEKSKKRIKILHENLARLKLKADIINRDANIWIPKKLADAVILDAPCSATGTLRKNPDILWKLSKNPASYKEKMRKLNNLQTKLLNSASKMINKNGILIYSVCSLEPEEGENRIKDFLLKNKDFKIIPIKTNDIYISSQSITKEGFVKTYPFMYSNKGGMDGFFVAKLEKKN